MKRVYLLILLVLFAGGLLACCTPKNPPVDNPIEEQPTPTPDPNPNPTPGPTPEPDPNPDPDPDPNPDPEPDPDPNPDPEPDPEPDPTPVINYTFKFHDGLEMKAYEQAVNLNQKARFKTGDKALKELLLAVSTRANLWTFGAYFTAVCELYNVARTPENKQLFENALLELNWYESTKRPDHHLVYASKGGTEKPAYYDDNVWLVIGLIKGYQITLDEALLLKAKRIMDWIYSGWNSNLGGIYWREFPDETSANEKRRNTCINGPAAWASAMLYEITNDNTYLNWGIRIYRWLQNTLYDKNNKTYSDSINDEGKHDYMKWTYNTGTMISASAYFYKISQDQKYANHAADLIEGALNMFVKTDLTDTAADGLYFRDNPWFRNYLVQGLLDAFRFISYDYGIHLEHIKNALVNGLENHLDDKGFLKYFWTSDEGEKLKPLYIAGNIEMIAIIVEYQNILKEVIK